MMILVVLVMKMMMEGIWEEPKTATFHTKFGPFFFLQGQWLECSEEKNIAVECGPFDGKATKHNFQAKCFDPTELI